MNKQLLTAALLGALITLAGCSSTSGTSTTDASSAYNSNDSSLSSNRSSPSQLCDADPAQNLLGKAPQADALAQIKQVSGAKQVRTLLPGQVMTMEYNPERVTVLVGDSETIIRINCG